MKTLTSILENTKYKGSELIRRSQKSQLVKGSIENNLHSYANSTFELVDVAIDDLMKANNIQSDRIDVLKRRISSSHRAEDINELENTQKLIALIKKGVKLDPIVISDKLHIFDGFHRVEAYFDSNVKTIKALQLIK